MRAFSSSRMALDRKQQPEPLGVSEELQARVSDKKLLKSHGLIGGDWVPASDGATYQVRAPRVDDAHALLGHARFRRRAFASKQARHVGGAARACGAPRRAAPAQHP